MVLFAAQTMVLPTGFFVPNNCSLTFWPITHALLQDVDIIVADKPPGFKGYIDRAGEIAQNAADRIPLAVTRPRSP